MPADSTGISDTDAKKIAEMVIKMRIEGVDKSTTQFEKLKSGLVGVERSVHSLESSFHSLLSPIQKIAGVVGAGMGFSNAIQTTEKYSKSLISLSAQLNKYGTTSTDVEKKVNSLSQTLSLTRAEAADLASQFEKTFHAGNMERTHGILKNIVNVVGSNVDAIKQMGTALGQVTMQYSDLQGAMETLGSKDKERLREHIQSQIMSGKMDLQQAKTLQDFISQNKQMSSIDKEKLDNQKQIVATMQELRTSFESIALVIGQAVMPFMKKLADLAKEYKETISSVGTFLAQWGVKIGIALVVGKTVLTVLTAIRTMSMLPSLFGGASGNAAALAAQKAAVASAAEATSAAKRACQCSSSGGGSQWATQTGVGSSPPLPGGGPAPEAPKTPWHKQGAAAITNKVAQGAMGVFVVGASIVAGSALGKGLAEAMGGKSSTAQAAGGLIGSMGAGAMAGASVGGPVGAVVGAIAGIGYEFYNAFSAQKEANNAAKLAASEWAKVTGNARKKELSKGGDPELVALKAQREVARKEEEDANQEKNDNQNSWWAQGMQIATFGQTSIGQGDDHAEAAAAARARGQQLDFDIAKKQNETDKKAMGKQSIVADIKSGLMMGNSQQDQKIKAESEEKLKKKYKELDENISKDPGAKGKTGEELAKIAMDDPTGNAIMALGLSSETLASIDERVELMGAAELSQISQNRLADVYNKKLAENVRLRQAEGSLLDSLVEKSAMYGMTVENIGEIQAQSQKLQASSLTEIGQRQLRINTDRKTIEGKGEKHKETLVKLSNVNQEVDSMAKERNSAAWKEKTADQQREHFNKLVGLSKQRDDLMVEEQGELQVIFQLEANISSEKMEQNKRVVEMVNQTKVVYEGLKKQHELVKGMSDAFGQMPGAMSEQMQLKGTEDPAKISAAIAESKTKIAEAAEANLRVQKEGKALLALDEEGLKAGYKKQLMDPEKGNMTEAEANAALKGLNMYQIKVKIAGEMKTAEKEILGLTKTKFELDQQMVNLYNTKKDLAMAELGVTEAYIGLMDQAGMGIGASVQMRMQAIDQTGAALDQVNNKIAAQEKAIADGIGDAEDARQAKALELKKLQQEQVQLLTKQWELSKALREGWVSALTSQSIASGRVTKIMMTKQSNLATAIGEMGSAISSATGTNKSGQGARSSSKFGVDATGKATFTDPGNAFYAQDYQKEGGEMDMSMMKRATDMQIRGNQAGASSLFTQIGNKQQAARMSGSGTAYGAGVTGASAEFGPGSKPRAGAHGAVIPATSSTGGSGASSGAVASGGAGTPITLTFNVSTKAELDSLMKKIEEHLRKATSV